MGTIYLLTKFWLRFCSSPRSLNLTHLQPELKYSLLSLPRTGWPQDKIFSDLLTIPQGHSFIQLPHTWFLPALFVLYKRKTFLLNSWDLKILCNSSLYYNRSFVPCNNVLNKISPYWVPIWFLFDSGERGRQGTDHRALLSQTMAKHWRF